MVDNSPQNRNSFNAKNQENNNENIGMKLNLRLKNIIFAFLCFISVCLSAFAFDIDSLGFYINNKTGEGFYHIGDMLEARHNHSAIKLKDGRIFIAGGNLLESTEIFDVKTGKSTHGPKMSHERGSHPFLYLLENGNVLISGQMTFAPTNKIDIYNPTTNKIINIGEIDVKYCTFNKDTAFIFKLNNNEILITTKSIIFSDLYKYNLMNNEFKKINTNKNPIYSKYTLTNSYITQLENYIYILNGRTGTILKIDINNFEKINAETDLFTHKYFRYFDNKFIFLNNLQKVLFFKSNSIHFFDINTKSFTDIEFPFHLEPQFMTKFFSLKNNNILIFSYKYPDKNYKLIEFNPSTCEIHTKKYHSPNANAEILEFEKDSILFIGGKTPRNLKASEKIYLWKRNGVIYDK